MNYSEAGDAVLTSDWFWGTYNILCQEEGRTLETFQLFDENQNFNQAALSAKAAELFAKQDMLLLLESGSLQGMDALLAIVQMPSGIPVATVAINGAKNGALLAVQIGAASDAELAKKYKAYRENMAQEVMKKNQKLQETVKSL